MNKSKRDPLLFCFCGPSASGKSTIAQQLLKKVPSTQLSISTTTRAPRKGEQDGLSYYFIDRQAFESRVQSGAFLEYAEYGGNLYGTELRNLDDAVSTGKDLILDIDVQGVQKLKKRFANRVVTVFVFPPSFAELQKRLDARGANNPSDRERRLKRAQEEIDILLEPGFSDYLIVNDKLDEALAAASAVVAAERCRVSRFDRETLSALVGRAK